MKTLLLDAMAECKYRAPSMILVDDLDTLCHIPQDIANVAEDNHLTSLASSFCHALLSRFHEVEITEKLSDLKVIPSDSSFLTFLQNEAIAFKF